MAYKDILSKVIKESGLSLREISSRCSTQGFSISPSYISQLQTGKLPPPTEEVSEKIAVVCKTDPIPLIFEGYIEKAPDIVKYYFAVSTETIKQFLELIETEPYSEEQRAGFKQRFSKQIEANNILRNSNYLVSYLRKLQLSNKVKPAIDLYKFMSSKFSEKYENAKEENFYMEDESMAPEIPKGALLKYITLGKEEPKNADVILFYSIGRQEILVRRYNKLNDRIILIPDNKSSEIIEIKSLEEIIIYGKVISFINESYIK